MFDPNVTSITCGSLDFFESAVDFNDLAFLNLIMCMQESDKALSAKMNEIRQLNEVKRQMTADINHLNKCLARSNADVDEKNGLVYVPGGLDDPRDPDKSWLSDPDRQRQFERQWESFRRDGAPVQYLVDQNGDIPPAGTGTQNKTPLSGAHVIGGVDIENHLDWASQNIDYGRRIPTTRDLHAKNLFTRAEVEAKIEELRGRLEDHNSSSSIMMLDLQRLMNKRNEATQLVSNLEAKSHQTAQAILSNIK